MTVEGLRAALDQGVRAVVCTPRAQNPTGASLTAHRAAALREVLAEHPYVLVIQDDYYSFLSQQPFHSIIGPGHRRWALLRSVSKFVGPDMCLAVTATDPDTAGRLALRLSPGTTWVSHLLQRITHAVMTDPEALALIERAGEHYAVRNAVFAAAPHRAGTAGQGGRRDEPVGPRARASARGRRAVDAPRLAGAHWGRIPARARGGTLPPPAADRARSGRGGRRRHLAADPR